MEQGRRYVLTVAGFDPSGGAGVLADVKTFERHKVYGLAVNTAITVQTETVFHSLQWESPEAVIKAIDVLLNAYDIGVVKTGIVPSFEFLLGVADFIKTKNPDVKLIVDPVITASSGFTFQNGIQAAALKQLLRHIYLLTPNTHEALALTGLSDTHEAALALSEHCHVLLKGGHASEKTGVDILHSNGKTIEFKPAVTDVFPKHGSGCILSAAIASNLSLGLSLEDSCKRAKRYTEQRLMSNPSLLAYHHV